MEYTFPLAPWSYKCHCNFITIQVCTYICICIVIWGTIFVFHGVYFHLRSLGSWTHINIHECTWKYCKSANLTQNEGDFFWLPKSRFSILSQFWIFLHFPSLTSNNNLKYTQKRKKTCYVICSIKETIPQLPSLFRNYRHCQMKCAWGSPVFLQYFLYISQSGRSKWTFPVIWFSLTSDERSYIYLSIIWAETVSLKEAEYVTVKCVYSLQSRSSIQLSASNTENFFGTQITVILYNLPSWIFSITFYNYV